MKVYIVLISYIPFSAARARQNTNNFITDVLLCVNLISVFWVFCDFFSVISVYNLSLSLSCSKRLLVVWMQMDYSDDWSRGREKWWWGWCQCDHMTLITITSRPWGHRCTFVQQIFACHTFCLHTDLSVDVSQFCQQNEPQSLMACGHLTFNKLYWREIIKSDDSSIKMV